MSSLAAIAMLAASAAVPAAQEGLVTGDYLEDRSNRVYGCPCEWSSEYVSNGREAVLAWNVHAGQYAGTPLTGLRMAAVITSDFNLSAAWATRRSVLYLDNTAPEGQRRAGEAWLRSRYGDTLGRVVGVHDVPITFRMSADGAAVAIAEVLDVEMRHARFEDDTQPWAALLYEPFTRMVRSTLGTTTQTRYRDRELHIQWSRADTAITGYYGTFALR